MKAAGDKGYRYPGVHARLDRHMILPIIPQRSDQVHRDGRWPLDRRVYRRRAVVEQIVGWLEENCRVGTRYNKLAGSFLTFVNLAIIRRYLRIPDLPD